MFICKVQLPYGAGKKISELSDAAYAQLRQCVTSELAAKLPDDRSTFKENDVYTYSDIIVDDVETDALLAAGIEVTLKTIRGLSRGHGRDPVVQHITQISLANVGLLEVQQVTYEEDCCTDLLQDRLDAGWRILCVCPPKDSRRPTYILGRRDKK